MPLRLSIARLMAVISFVAFSLAALSHPGPLWASAAFSLALVSVAAAAAGALARHGNDRLPWAAFALAGGASLVLRLLAHDAVGSLNGLPRPLLYRLQDAIHPMTLGGQPYIDYSHTCLSLDSLLLGLAAALLARLVAGRGTS